MVSLDTNNGDIRRNGGYTFNEDSDEETTEDAPLMSRDPTQHTASSHVHLTTGYFSIIELLILIIYTVCLVTFSLIWSINPNSPIIIFNGGKTNQSSTIKGEKMLATFCMFHSLLWLIVAVTDRIVQWRHQSMRRKGYLRFYRRVKNLRRVPFAVISTGTASLLIFLSLVYYNNQALRNLQILQSSFTAFHCMYIIVGIEMLITAPCLLYYIVLTIIFNYMKPSPDVIQENTSMANSPTATLTSVGFRDGEELDELLERQADMIRYLQQHNASLGRRIMELQARTVE